MCADLFPKAPGKWGPYFICMKCGNINFRNNKLCEFTNSIFFLISTIGFAKSICCNKTTCPILPDNAINVKTPTIIPLIAKWV